MSGGTEGSETARGDALHRRPGGLLADLEELLGCKVDVVTADGLHWYIRDSVLSEAVPL